MSSIVLQNLFKISSRFFLSMIPHGCKFHMAGIIPGGGLGKLQGIKEEEYFARKDSELFENMSNNKNDLGHALHGHPTYHAVHDCACSVKHKNLLEEAYFLNDRIPQSCGSQLIAVKSRSAQGRGKKLIAAKIKIP